MLRENISHEYLKSAMDGIETLEGDALEEEFDRLLNELKHSSLILPGNMKGNEINIPTFNSEIGEYGMLFTDIDEFNKVFPNFKVEAHDHSIEFYLDMMENSNLKGFVVNLGSECFVLPRDLFNLIDETPEHTFPSDDSYTSEELKRLKDSINNTSLEQFINNPSNIGRYEELFDEISKSTLLALRISKENVDNLAEEGIISMTETGPIGFLYMDTLGGHYAVAFTSEEKISNVPTALNRYSQIVNFSQMTNFMLNDDMDGIIINPNSENILLTREVLLEYSNLLEKTCNDHKLNSAIFHMFPIEA